ncbi:Protein kinase domain [Dillenia turbinata]|uniref:non-specific serine/threonine protein kinase n=1 Tax=Dillenia turbinata TaxID=194707 RepID=A0AAN8V0K7_9MAGN
MSTALTAHEFSSDSFKHELDKAWHLMAILLRFGHPLSPEELASRCQLFTTSPDFVHFLCSIPNSPILLADDSSLVMISPVAIFALELFELKLRGRCGPRIMRRVLDLEPKRPWGDNVKTYFRKRKRSMIVDSDVFSGTKRRILSLRCAETGKGKVDLRVLPLPDQEPDTLQVQIPVSITESVDAQIEVSGPVGERIFRCIPDLNETANFMREFEAWILKEEYVGEIGAGNSLDCNSLHFPETNLQDYLSTFEAALQGSNACDTLVVKSTTDTGSKEMAIVEDTLFDDEISGKDEGTYIRVGNCATTSALPVRDPMPNVDNMVNLETVQAIGTGYLLGLEAVPSVELSVDNNPDKQQQPTRSPSKLKDTLVPIKPSPLVLQNLPGSLPSSKVRKSPRKQDQGRNIQATLSMKQKLKQNQNCDKHNKGNPVDTTATLKLKEHRTLPNFEAYSIEEEEGSGGYGTVYRATRKNDGKKFAIKYPHANAPRRHVHNEQKMLERFGGKNFIIKYEDFFKSGNSECFVLEHVDHDRPEVLKREIDISQLQWYGYCMFKALAYVHKQGVVHRDVKPGNFLFSRKANKGYLIDFNLALDLQQKLSTGNRSKSGSSISFDHVPLPHLGSSMSIKDRKSMKLQSVAINQEKAVDSRPIFDHKDMKKRTYVGSLKAYTNFGGRKKIGSQGGDGSGITSARDATSTRTPSAEKLREPLPSFGRKELLSLVQDALHTPNHNEVNSPISQRKRVAAPPGNVERNIFYPSPMPLHSAGVAVVGAGLLKNKGDGKQKREGSCVGTKGFRAPEVLFRSPYQGCKVDIWSAGVTLLYLMVGRTPFTGEPEQNIKEIAKLKGSEDLWEVAKLHDRESSFPTELFEVQSLHSVKLESWCKMNTKRPDFFNQIPASLFDLVDRCLTVNPRLRISAEEALKHEFFAPCHESLRKQRMLRRESMHYKVNQSCPLEEEGRASIRDRV